MRGQCGLCKAEKNLYLFKDYTNIFLKLRKLFSYIVIVLKTIFKVHFKPQSSIQAKKRIFLKKI